MNGMVAEVVEGKAKMKGLSFVHAKFFLKKKEYFSKLFLQFV